MKKKLICIFVCTGVLLMSLSGCGSQNGASKETEKKVSKISETEEEEQEETEEIIESSGSIAFGDVVTIADVAEFTIKSCSWEQEILPSNTSGVYSYYEDVPGETFLVFKGNMKNLSGTQFNEFTIGEAMLTINDKYKFAASIEFEESDGTSFYGDVKPLQTLDMIIWVSVTDEAKNIFEEGLLDISITNDPESLEYYFSDDTPSNQYTLRFE